MLESLLALVLGLISVIITFSIYAMISSLKNKIDNLSNNKNNKNNKNEEDEEDKEDDNNIDDDDDIQENFENNKDDNKNDKNEENLQVIKYTSGSERCYKPTKAQINSDFDRKLLPTNIKGVNIDDPNYEDIDYAVRQINEMDRRNPKYDSNFPFMEFETDYKI